jgi:ABC-type Fe3+/spermidine/putrescine transport system ATPase subunit
MLEVNNLSVVLGDAQILHDVSLTVGDGEVVGVLGPSGSGKSTLLRAIAGIIEPVAGTVMWDGVDVTNTPTHLRQFGLMFQGYALFPHMTVAGNVGFGLRVSGADDIEKKVATALCWVGLEGFGPRGVDSLSGGEQQRVALARTLAPEPRLVMLDEPLGALDRNLRRQLVAETRSVLEGRGVTAIVVTHDREEAVALSDRLAIMRDGTIVQTGRLDEILADPTDDWVANFIS